MSGFRRILLIINPNVTNTEAFSRAASLAQSHEAKLRLLSISNEGAHDSNVSARDPRPFNMREIACRAKQQELQDFLAPLERAGCDVQCQVRSGTPHREIIQTVIQEKHDLVITTCSRPVQETPVSEVHSVAYASEVTANENGRGREAGRKRDLLESGV